MSGLTNAASPAVISLLHIALAAGLAAFVRPDMQAPSLALRHDRVERDPVAR